MKRLEDMLVMQQSLNESTSGKDWIKGFTDKGKPINWRRCIYMEAAELIDSYPWKHWKNIDAQPDWNNIKIEVVDIWHFVLSEALRDYKINRKGDIEKLTNDIIKLANYQSFKENLKPLDEDIYKQIAWVENFVKTLFTSEDVLTLIDAFFNMAYLMQVNLDVLYRLYIGKNILNLFRQDHGYKEGKYIKQWNGLEDNVMMQEFLEKQPDVTPEKLYALLEDAYEKVERA